MVSYSISSNKLLFNYEYDTVSISFSIPLDQIEVDEDRVLLLGEDSTLEITKDSMELKYELEWGEMKSVIEFDEEEAEQIRKFMKELNPTTVCYPDGYNAFLSEPYNVSKSYINRY